MSGGPHVRVAIIGSGFAGIGLAVRLRRRGITDFVILERGSEVGGVWRDNCYPGCACDVPSHLYSFSFAPNPRWSRTYSSQPEILEYLRRVARNGGVLPHIRFQEEVTAARWDATHQRWVLDTSRGRLTAQFLVAAQGGLSEPRMPDVSGLDSFGGEAFHSARWNHDVDLRGRRVAVIGTGASAIQIVPRIQPDVAQLYVVQRTPPWILPHRDRPIRDWERRLFRTLPATQKLVRGAIFLTHESYAIGFIRGSLPVGERISLQHLQRQVHDPALRARLTPNYRLGCKRVLPSNDYYPALTRPNVELVTAPLTEVHPHSMRTGDGVERDVDTIIFATGFQVTETPIADRVHGRDGRTLSDTWHGSAQAYRGTLVSGFPNLFFMTGPNTGLGHTSVVLMMEAQYGYLIDALQAMRRRGAASIEVRDDAEQRFNDEVQQRLAGTVWNTGGCASWYFDRNGRNSTLWPGTTINFRRLLRRFDAAAHVFEAATVTSAAA